MGFGQLNRSAQLYVASVIAAGTIAIGQSVYSMATATSIDYRWLLLAALTIVSGSANVKLASVSATISVSETFVVTSVILFGAGPGTLIVALDAFVVSSWVAVRNREVYRLFFNISAPSISIWIAAQTFFALLGRPPLAQAAGEVGITEVAFPLLVFTVVYFLLNSWLIAIAIGLKERVSAPAVWRDNLLWLSLNYFGGASVAALLVGYRSTLDVGLLLVIAPILLVLYFTFKTAMGRVEDANRHLEEVNRLHFSTIETLAMAIDAKDQVTHGHIRRVQALAVQLAKDVGVKDEDELKAIEAAALLHDMGKLAVPEHILNKPGPLNASELARMKSHARIGADILSSIQFPYPVVPIVRHHHENWDGTGYPDAIKGTEIPVGARVLAVVDCYDALTSDRPYRPQLPMREAIEILSARRGSMYDPLIVDTFVRLVERLPSVEVDQESVDVFAVSSQLTTTEGPKISRRLLDASQLALNQLVRESVAKVAILFITDTDATTLTVVTVSGVADETLRNLQIEVGQRLSGWVAANGRSIVNSDPALDLGHELARRLDLGNALSIPGKSVGSEAIVVLTAYSSRNACFGPEDIATSTACIRKLESFTGETVDC
jgi:putative nucleotidyltransferase with HDIG domain